MLITFDFNPPTHSRALSPRLRSSGWISHMNLVYILQCSCPSLRNIIWFSLPSRKEKFKFPSLIQSVACTSGLSQNISPGNISLPRQGEQESHTSTNPKGRMRAIGCEPRASFPRALQSSQVGPSQSPGGELWRQGGAWGSCQGWCVLGGKGPWVLLLTTWNRREGTIIWQMLTQGDSWSRSDDVT